VTLEKTRTKVNAQSHTLETWWKSLQSNEHNEALITKETDFAPISRQEKGQWVVKVVHQTDQLVLGPESQKLVWPNNDPTTVEIWRLTMGVAYQTSPVRMGPGQNLTGLSPKFILIRWNREDRSLHMV
jgi:hypothetical protein